MVANGDRKISVETLSADLIAHQIREEEILERGEKRMDAIEKDLQPIQKMYWAIIGSGAVATALIGVLMFLYTSDRSEMKILSTAIQQQGLAIERLLVTTNNMASIMEKDMARLDRHLESNK